MGDLSKCKILTRHEAAEYCRVSITTVDQYKKTEWKNFVISLGAAGRRVFFDREKIDRWIESGGVHRQ